MVQTRARRNEGLGIAATGHARNFAAAHALLAGALGVRSSWRPIISYMASLPAPRLTEEEYLELERRAESKSEFFDGQMFAMAGGTLNHALLSNTIGAMLHRQMPPGCRTCNSDLRIKSDTARFYTYPDCSVICGDAEYAAGNHRDVVLNPVLIVEVLSPSTEAYDRGKKFELYRTIPSLREYMLVHQDRRHVEHYSRQDDSSWVLREYFGADSSVDIQRLQVRIPLGELYAAAVDLDQ